jgi:microsomal dipeptidase-like Zn-dependent dipeptidase
VHPERPTFERLIAHIDHIVSVAGIDSAALGGDFDGGGDVVGDATEVPQITEALGKRGYAEADIRQILGGNALRVLQQTIG